jgi:heat shock protein HslJ
MTVAALGACNNAKKDKSAAKKSAATRPSASSESKVASALAGSKYVAVHSNGTQIHLEFDAKDSRFYGRVVNRYSGSYTANTDGTIAFGPAVSNMMAGLSVAMEAESGYFKFLPKVQKYNIAGSVLTLEAGDGETMRFEKE